MHDRQDKVHIKNDKNSVYRSLTQFIYCEVFFATMPV